MRSIKVILELNVIIYVVIIVRIFLFFRDQGIYGRPIFNASEAIIVYVALHLVQILDLDEHNQLFTVSMSNDFVSDKNE